MGVLLVIEGNFIGRAGILASEIAGNVHALRQIEAGLMSTWPALEYAFDGSFVLRAAAGFTGRSNSVIFLDANDTADLSTRIAGAETFYRRRGQEASFRQTPLMPPEMVEALTARGYTIRHPSVVLAGALPDINAEHREPAIHLREHNGALVAVPAPWLQCCRTASTRTDAHATTLVQMMQALTCDHAAYLWHTGDDGSADATVFAAVHRGWLTVHLVATLPVVQRRGYARALMQRACAWAREQGAQGLWIAVEADNSPAIALYRQLGLREAFEYCYWTPRLDTKKGEAA